MLAPIANVFTIATIALTGSRVVYYDGEVFAAISLAIQRRSASLFLPL